MSRLHQVRLGPLPSWLDLPRFLGLPFESAERPDGDWEASLSLGTSDAADVAARMRGLSPGGRPLSLACEPPLPRAAIRAARTADARRRRLTTAGFEQAAARADAEGRRSLTPERLALSMAEQAKGVAVVDAMCGVGGNAIAFARAGCGVTAIELDAQRLSHARHNAGVYGVRDQVRFVHGDAAASLPHVDAQLAFVDPPWGPIPARKAIVADDLPVLSALLPLTRRFEQVWLKLPASFDDRTLSGFRARAVFGEALGDHRRIKFLWLVRVDT